MGLAPLCQGREQELGAWCGPGTALGLLTPGVLWWGNVEGRAWPNAEHSVCSVQSRKNLGSDCVLCFISPVLTAELDVSMVGG